MDDVLGSSQADNACTNCVAMAAEGLPLKALGDTQYDNGGSVLYMQNYDPSECGAIKSSTYPVVGNHEYQTAGSSGYNGYFGSLASPNEPECKVNCLGYYAFDAAGGGWRIVVLNTNCGDLASEHPGDGCAAGTTQVLWLRAELTSARAKNKHVFVVSHHPRWSPSTLHPSSSDGEAQALWSEMVTLGADAWITGHAHDFEPQDAAGKAALGGLVEIIVGTEGEMKQGPEAGCGDGLTGKCAPNTVALNHLSVGYLKVTLSRSGLAFTFVPTALLYRCGAISRCCHDPTSPVKALTLRMLFTQ